MNRTTRNLLLIYAGFVILKSILSLSSLTLSIYSDEYLYLKLSQSIAEGSYAVHGMPSNAYPPLYPLALALANVVKDTAIAYFLMKCINALISSAIIFPAFFLLKEFLTEKESLKGAILVGLYPSIFSFTQYLMSENLFYVLFLCAVLTIFHALKTQKVSWHIAAGVLIGLSFLTRTIGLLLVPLYVFAQLMMLIKNKKVQSWKHSISFLVVGICCAAIIMVPWIMYNKSFDAVKPLGAYTREVMPPGISSFPQILLWIFLYAAVIILSTGIILPAAAISFMKKKKSLEEKILGAMLLSAMMIFVLAGANHSIHGNVKASIDWILGRPIGRYIDTIAPLILITGFIALQKKNLSKKVLFACSSLVIMAMPILIHFSLAPVNNISLTFFEGIKRFTSSLASQDPAVTSIIIIMTLMILWACALHRIKSASKYMAITAIFFIVTNIAIIGAAYYNTNKWDDHPQIKISRWMNSNTQQNEVVVIDKKDCMEGDVKENVKKLCHVEGHTALIGTWIRNKIQISTNSNDGDYFITTSKKELPLLKEESGIFVYKSKEK